ncbi:hypothetical protein [Massilia horti]|uniref:hypothetical protein n=1 Tax=Massilia horti TaxID=2562153 RepID=UPI00197D0BC1|nr:hypothetical protein [Massilia horti]
MEFIAFKDRYKYQLTETYSLKIGIHPDTNIEVDGYLSLDPNGLLTIKRGYAWDGPSGPTFDTPNFMRGSLVHDALYQIMREKKLDREIHRAGADELLRKICLEDGMSWLRASWVHLGVRLFGEPASDPAHKHPTIYAPRKPSDVVSPSETEIQTN